MLRLFREINLWHPLRCTTAKCGKTETLVIIMDIYFYHFTGKIREINVFLTMNWFHEIFSSESNTTVWYIISEIFPHCKHFSSNWFTVQLFSNKVNFTKFLQKIVGEKFANFHTVLHVHTKVWYIISEIFPHYKIFSSNWFTVRICNSLVKKLQ